MFGYKRKKCVIIGCGRSGTSYISKVLSETGLDIQHETSGVDGSANWYRTPYPRIWLKLRHEFIVHQVRNPLNCISSCQTLNEHSWTKINRHISFSSEEPLVLRCAKYWYHWNVMAEPKSDLLIRLENLENDLPALCKVLNVHFDERVLESVSQKTNTRENNYETVTWEMINEFSPEYHDKCKELALKYGYSIS